MVRKTAFSFIKDAVLQDTPECIEWPFAVNSFGYGSVYHDGGPRLAHRLVCKLVHGEPLDARLEAAHSCGNRRCVNWRHIRWATHGENMRDKIIDGTSRRTIGERHGASKLRASDVLVIRRRMAAGEGPSSISRDYAVTPEAIHAIKVGKTWRHLADETR